MFIDSPIDTLSNLATSIDTPDIINVSILKDIQVRSMSILYNTVIYFSLNYSIVLFRLLLALFPKCLQKKNFAICRLKTVTIG